jgi:hypothetical protein
VPAVADVGGVPETVGGWLGGGVTWIAKAASDAVALPSLTEITMLEEVPTFADVGVPVRDPVPLLKAAHAGLFAMVKLRVSLSTSDATGVNE